MQKKQEYGTYSCTSEWLYRHSQLYRDSTSNSFIQSICDGSLHLGCFKKWLGQDYHFVLEFSRFLATVVLKCPRESPNQDMQVILAGLAALSDELSWFKKEALKWGINTAEVQPEIANQNYCRFLESMMSPEVEYAVAVVALWTIELVYYQSFAKCLEKDAKTAQELVEACQRWGNSGFKTYCTTLQKIADEALKTSSMDTRFQAEAAFVEVLNMEIEFWNMCFKS